MLPRGSGQWGDPLHCECGVPTGLRFGPVPCVIQGGGTHAQQFPLIQQLCGKWERWSVLFRDLVVLLPLAHGVDCSCSAREPPLAQQNPGSVCSRSSPRPCSPLGGLLPLRLPSSHSWWFQSSRLLIPKPYLCCSHSSWVGTVCVLFWPHLLALPLTDFALNFAFLSFIFGHKDTFCP